MIVYGKACGKCCQNVNLLTYLQKWYFFVIIHAVVSYQSGAMPIRLAVETHGVAVALLSTIFIPVVIFTILAAVTTSSTASLAATMLYISTISPVTTVSCTLIVSSVFSAPLVVPLVSVDVGLHVLYSI